MWKAKFTNGSVLDENDIRDGVPILYSFAEIQKRIDAFDTLLESLSIVQGARMYTVRMSDGMFSTSVSGIEIDFYAINLELVKSGDLKNIRPIYFVRETVVFEEGTSHNMKGTTPVTNFTALGFQANINGTNIKRYLAIFPDGMFYIEDK